VVERVAGATRPLAELLYEEHDVLTALKAKAEKALLAEARRHREWRLLKTSPGLGPIRTAELLPVVVTPYRFQSRSHFWSYCGLGIVMRSSSDWVRTPTGQWVKAAVQQTGGLNRNFNHTLKRIFKGAATTVTRRRGSEPVTGESIHWISGLGPRVRVPTDRLCAPGEPNEAMGHRAPDRRMVPVPGRRTQRL
jgi:transposase